MPRDPDMTSDGARAMHVAAMSSHLACARLLIEARAEHDPEEVRNLVQQRCVSQRSVGMQMLFRGFWNLELTKTDAPGMVVKAHYILRLEMAIWKFFTPYWMQGLN